MKTWEIRHAELTDTMAIYEMIVELATYEKEPDAVSATPNDIQSSLFGENAQAKALMAVSGSGQPLGFAVYFHNYSTWLGKKGVYLEDLYVSPGVRGSGIGKELLLTVARIAVEAGCERLDWAVLDWNRGAIDFYKSLGAKHQSGWQIFRLAGEGLIDAAAICEQ